jgi:putative transposase
VHQQSLRSRGITAVIPEPADQTGHRKNRGSRGGRPVSFDSDRYRGRNYRSRNVVERDVNRLRNWRGLATRHDEHAAHHCGGMALGAAPLTSS